MPKLPSDGNFSHEIHVAYTELFSWQNCFADVFLIYFSVESVDCAIPPCSICRLLARRSVEQPGCCHTWHGVFVLFLCAWFLLCSRWGQVPLAEFCFCLVCTQYSFAFTVLSMSQTRWQMKLITLKKTIPTKFNLNSNTSCRIIPVKPNGLYVSSIYQDTVQMLKNISFRGKLSMQRQFVL